jgi:succinoglycan biosynthesis protein ExoA
VVRLDCHTRYPPEYLARCVRASEETGAWNVGAPVVPRGRTRMERAVAYAMDSPFGGIGWTRASSNDEPTEVDTVTYGAFRREVFDHIGLFDEALVRNQDDEFNTRILGAGGTIVLDPRFTLFYVPRGSFRGVVRQYYEYGLWKVPVMLKHRRVLSARSLAPIALVGSFAGLAALGLVSRRARRLLALEAAGYGAAAVGFAARRVATDGDWALLPRVAAVFPAFHLSYGTGMAHGWLRAAAAD